MTGNECPEDHSDMGISMIFKFYCDCPNKATLVEDCKVFGVDIPYGFSTDGASVPKWGWWFIHPFGTCFKAALVHDWRICGQSRSGKETDREFYRNVRASGVRRFRASVAYLAVRFHTMFVRGVWG